MKFIRQNAILLAILAVFLVLLGMSIYLLRHKATELSMVRQKLEDQTSQKKALLAKSPFRSTQNVEAIGRNTHQEKQLIAQALKYVRQIDLDFKPVEGAAFRQELFIALRRMRDVLKQNGVKFPDRFQFGFETYATHSPRDEYTPILKKQFIVAEELVALIVSNRFLELSSLKRPEVEGVSSGAGHSPETEPLISTGGKIEYIDSKDYLYTTMPFELKVMCDTESLRNFLDALCRSKFVLIPRVVLVENEKPDPLLSNLPKATGREMSGETPVRASSGATASRGGEVPGAVTTTNLVLVDPILLPFVLGEERIKVTMLIDWLEFRSDELLAAPKKPGAGARRSTGTEGTGNKGEDSAPKLPVVSPPNPPKEKKSRGGRMANEEEEF